jgi:hypothetical protein
MAYVKQNPGRYIDPTGRYVQVITGFCEAFPAACVTVAEVCTGAVIAGGIWIFGESTAPQMSTPDEETCDNCTAPPPPPHCEEEWANARLMCTQELSKKNPSKLITGGYKNVAECSRGLVSEACGGNKVEY